MKHIIRTMLPLLMLTGITLAQDITPIFSWKADISRETTYTLNLRRRNTAYFRPTIYNNGTLQTIPTNSTVTFRYQGVGLTNYYTIAGTVHSSTGGVLSVTWTPLCEATNANYEWEYMVKDGDVEVVRLIGTLNLTPSIASGTVTNPAFYRLDAVTNRGVAINGSYITNGAVITVEAGIGTNVASMLWDNPPVGALYENDPVFATNGVKRSDTNGWVVSEHNFPTFAQATQIVADVTSTSVFANAISGATATQIVSGIMETGTAYSATTAVPTNRTITFNSQVYSLDSNIVFDVATNGQTATDVTNIVTAMSPSLSVLYAGTSYYATASATSADTTAHAALTDTAHGGIVPQSRTLNLNGTVYDLSANRTWTIIDAAARTQASNVQTYATAVSNTLQTYATAVSNQASTHAALTTTAHGGIVPSARTININGTVYDLSADRTWTVSRTATQTLQQVVDAGNGATNVGSLAGVTDLSGTGRRVFGTGLNVTNIDAAAVGASQSGVNNGGTQTISGSAYGASQSGYNKTGTQTIGSGANGASQSGNNGGAQTINNYADGASQSGRNYGTQTIGERAYGAQQRGQINVTATATNNGIGAVQLLDLTNGQQAVTTAGGAGSILLGAGTASNRYAIVAGDGQQSHGNGSITAGGGFWGSGAGIPDLVPTNRTITINGTTKAFDANVSFTVDATNAVGSETVSNIVNSMAPSLSVLYANTAGTSVYATAAGTATDSTKVPTNRLLTINGTTYPMDADMSFTVAGTGWVSAVEASNIVSAMAPSLSVLYAATAASATDATARASATNALAVAQAGTNLATTANVNAANALAVAQSGTNLATVAQANIDTHEALTTTAHGGIVPSTRTITINGIGAALSSDLIFTVSDATARTQGSNAQSTANSATNLITVHAALTTNAHGGIVATTDPRLSDTRVDPTARTAASNAQATAETATNLATLAQATANAAVPTNDVNFLAAVTGAVYGAGTTPTVANRVLTIGTNNFGGGGSTITFAGTGGRTTVRNHVITHEFLDTTSTGIVFTVTNAMTMNVMLVAGGGGGGSGGGGGGGVIVTNMSVTNGTYILYVGDGGWGGSGMVSYRGTNGTSTTGLGLTAVGGGGGGANSVGTYNGANGGSGGGGGGTTTASSGGSGTTGQGNSGAGNNSVGSPYPAGGGGGASGAGSTPSASGRGGVGGAGYTNPYTGETYGSGGGGAVDISGSFQVGGKGGKNAGNGADGQGASGSDAIDGFGGGGGGYGNRSAGSLYTRGGKGGSGCVVVSYSW